MSTPHNQRQTDVLWASAEEWLRKIDQIESGRPPQLGVYHCPCCVEYLLDDANVIKRGGGCKPCPIFPYTQGLGGCRFTPYKVLHRLMDEVDDALMARGYDSLRYRDGRPLTYAFLRADLVDGVLEAARREYTFIVTLALGEKWADTAAGL